MDEGIVHSGDGDLSQHAVASMYKVCCKVEVIILCKDSCTFVKQCEAVSALGGCSDERLKSLSSLKGTKNKMF